VAGLQKILLVEDDPQISEIYNTILQTHGYQVALAANYDEAVSQAKSFQPDLIILDVMIPGKSGLEVMHTLRTDPQYHSQTKKIVLLTNLGENEEVKRALEKNEADGYVVKADISAEDLDDIIKSFSANTAPPDTAVITVQQAPPEVQPPLPPATPPPAPPGPPQA
jgi:CheY-like chemotaxis protein